MQGDGIGSLDPTKLPKQRYREPIEAFTKRLQDLKGQILSPPEGFAEVATTLREASKIAKTIHHLRSDSGDELFGLYPELNTVAFDGYETVKATRDRQQLDDPFAFLDEPTKEELAEASAPKPLDMDCVRNSFDCAKLVLSSLETNELTGEIVQGLWGSAHFLRQHQPSFSESTGTLNNWMEASRTAKDAIVAIAIKFGIDGERLNKAVLDAESILWEEVITRADQLSRDHPPASSNPTTRSRKRKDKATKDLGRPPKYDRNADRRLLEAWETGGHRTYADLGSHLEMTRKEVEKAIQRAKKRRHNSLL